MRLYGEDPLRIQDLLHGEDPQGYQDLLTEKTIFVSPVLTLDHVSQPCIANLVLV